MTITLKLKPHETMKRRRAQERLAVDADNVHRVIRNNPGLPGRSAISTHAGLSPARVMQVIKRINAGETGHARVEYGEVAARGGPFAGQTVRGWYSTNIKRHHVVLDQADEHSALVEVGIRRSRLVRFAQAQGIRGAEAYVANMEERLGMSAEAMATEADLETFEELILEDLAEQEAAEILPTNDGPAA